MRDSIALEILHVIHERIKCDGYKRHGWFWNKHNEETVDAIDLQKSKTSTRDDGSMTVNVGIALPDVYSILWRKESPSFIPEVDCIIRRRISRIINDGSGGNLRTKDLWWRFDENTDAEELGGQIADLIVSKAYPWFNRLRSRRAVAEYLRYSKDVFDEMAPSRISLCILDALLNGEARQDAFEELKAKFPPWSSRIDIALDQLRGSGKIRIIE
jgi:hypothetical protein